MLRSSNIEEFNWNMLMDELRVHSPLYFAIMQGCAKTKTPRQNHVAVLGMCTAILLKHKFSKMCIIQKMISLILYGGHAGKQVMIRGIIWSYVLCYVMYLLKCRCLRGFKSLTLQFHIKRL